METEAEYEKWFDEKLGNFESIYSDSEKTIFDYCPKRFNLKYWLSGLIILTIIFMILAFIFYKMELNYLFNISLSISTGLIVNLIFLIITNAKERYINYYSSIIPILQKRRNQLSDAYHECWLQMSIAYQQNDKDKWYKYWHRLINMSCVAIDFHNFLIEKLPNDYKYDDNFQDVSDRLTNLNNMAFKFANTDEKIDFFGDGDDQFGAKRFDAGLGVGVAYEINKFFIDLSGEFGLAKLADGDGAPKNMNFSIGVGYKF